MNIKSLLLALGALAVVGTPVSAEDNLQPAGESGGGKAPREKNVIRDTELPQISVIDKLLAIEASLNAKKRRGSEEDWARDYEDLYQRFQRNGQLSAVTGAGSQEVMNAMALGIKASDAVLALKGRDVEGLNQASEQIQQIALKLGASRRELGMADTVKRFANDRRWLDAFMALGFLQRNVLYYLKENPDRKPQAVLIILGGWLQGGRCVTDVITREYTDDVSNILREPRLVDLIKQNVDALPDAYLKDPLIADIDKQLPEIRKRVAVGFHDPVKIDDVKWLHQTFEGFVLRVCPKPEPKQSPTTAAPAAPATSAAAPAPAPATGAAAAPATKPGK